MGRDRPALGLGNRDLGADAALKRHLGQRHGDAAVRAVVAGGDPVRRDQGAHEVAVAALGGEVDGGRGAVLAARDLA